MTRTAAARRPGITLIEVMTAMFVMAVGMLALFTLFPLGAIQMSKSLQFGRAAETCLQAEAMTKLWWQRDVVENTNPELEPAFLALRDPANGLPALADTDTGPSYPVAVDPIGYQARASVTSRFSFAQLSGGNFPRRSVNYVTNSANPSALSFSNFSLKDDITFSEVGAPDTTASGVGVPVVRQGKYNWAAVIQRQNNLKRLTADKFTADLTILVFDGRSPGVAPNAAETLHAPVSPAAVGTSQLVLNLGAELPKSIRKGRWIMDGTLDPATGTRNAIWYRIQGIEENPPLFTLDLQTPFTRPVTTSSRFYAIEGLLEVYVRPPLTGPTSKIQGQ